MKTTKEQQRILMSLAEHYDKEDNYVRENQVKHWKELKLLWQGLQRTYYSEVAHDWRVYEESDDDNDYYNKEVNVLRAYLESIIAALSIIVPPIKCFPDNADDPLDLSTAKTGDKIAGLIFRHNNAPLLWLHALFLYCTEGLIAARNYNKEDEQYGTYKLEKYEKSTEQVAEFSCPICGAPIDSTDSVCSKCDNLIIPQLREKEILVSRLVETQTLPKSRQLIEVFGGMNVKVPAYARTQSECPYLQYEHEINYVFALDLYEDLDVEPGQISNDYAANARLSSVYSADYPRDLVTRRETWFRPCAYHVLNDDDYKYLINHFPKGVCLTRVHDQFADARPEELDKHWTLVYNPLTDHVHFDPLANLVISVQEITNDIISLVLQTIEHGIPQTFADPMFLDFNAYRKMRVSPGSIIPTKTISGNKSVQQGFHEIKTATLSQEVLPFARNIQEMGQLVTGALPSLFGGSMESKTASEYSMSRAQALQRLQITWKMLCTWWKEVFTKAIPGFIEGMKDDERDVQRLSNGNFVNVFIRKAELEGKIGRIELEANENLPLTWNQVKDAVMQLLQNQNPEILAILGAPENLPIIREAIGLNDFVIPGEDDRNKEYEEIKQLLQSAPITVPPDPMLTQQALMSGMPPPQPQEVSSVEIDPDIDNHMIGFTICRDWLVSDAGRLAKTDNTNGYRNVLLHAKAHKDAMMPPQIPQSGNEQPPQRIANKLNRPAPIQNESDVQMVQ
jgi:hypothetical protein